jgi:hypothetical protein
LRGLFFHFGDRSDQSGKLFLLCGVLLEDTAIAIWVVMIRWTDARKAENYLG